MQTIVGELYLNWGWAGVIGGMLVLGMIFRAIYRAPTRDQPFNFMEHCLDR